MRENKIIRFGIINNKTTQKSARKTIIRGNMDKNITKNLNCWKFYTFLTLKSLYRMISEEWAYQNVKWNLGITIEKFNLLLFQ